MPGGRGHLIKHLTSGPTPSVISQYDYTYGGDRSLATWTVDQGSGAKTWTFGYNGSRELTQAALRDGSQTLLESHTYGYDKAGNRIQVGDGATAPKNYDVNALNQLLTERDHGKTTFAGYVDEPAKVTVNGKSAKVMSTDGGAPFRFEALVDLDAGANTVVVQATDGQNNVATKTYAVTTTGDSKKYEYDGNGNLRYEKQANGTVLKEYRWDQQNRLVRVIEGTHESVYEYDGASRRVRIKELASSVETKNETFVWCGSRICQKRASNGSTVVRSYFGQGFEESGTTDYFYTRDHLGSVREVVGSDGTTVSGRVSYTPWGEVTETGAVLWLSADPIGLHGGLNLYGYVANEPVDLIDPDGMRPNRPGWDFCDVPILGLICNVWPAFPYPGPPTDGLDFGPPGGGGGGWSGGMCPNNPPEQPDDCKQKATPWQLKTAGLDAHEVKNAIVGKKASGQHDICKCDSGGFAIKKLGCRGPIVERL